MDIVQTPLPMVNLTPSKILPFRIVYQVLEKLRSSGLDDVPISSLVSQCHRVVEHLERVLHVLSVPLVLPTTELEDAYAQVERVLKPFVSTCNACLYSVSPSALRLSRLDPGCLPPPAGSWGIKKRRHLKELTEEFSGDMQAMSLILANIIYTTTLDAQRRSNARDPTLIFILRQTEKRHRMLETLDVTRQADFQRMLHRKNEDIDWDFCLRRFFDYFALNRTRKQFGGDAILLASATSSVAQHSHPIDHETPLPLLPQHKWVARRMTTPAVSSLPTSAQQIGARDVDEDLFRIPRTRNNSDVAMYSGSDKLSRRQTVDIYARQRTERAATTVPAPPPVKSSRSAPLDPKISGDAQLSSRFDDPSLARSSPADPLVSSLRFSGSSQPTVEEVVVPWERIAMDFGGGLVNGLSLRYPGLWHIQQELIWETRQMSVLEARRHIEQTLVDRVPATAVSSLKRRLIRHCLSSSRHVSQPIRSKSPSTREPGSNSKRQSAKGSKVWRETASDVDESVESRRPASPAPMQRMTGITFDDLVEKPTERNISRREIASNRQKLHRMSAKGETSNGLAKGRFNSEEQRSTHNRHDSHVNQEAVHDSLTEQPATDPTAGSGGGYTNDTYHSGSLKYSKGDSKASDLEQICNLEPKQEQLQHAGLFQVAGSLLSPRPTISGSPLAVRENEIQQSASLDSPQLTAIRVVMDDDRFRNSERSPSSNSLLQPLSLPNLKAKLSTSRSRTQAHEDTSTTVRSQTADRSSTKGIARLRSSNPAGTNKRSRPQGSIRHMQARPLSAISERPGTSRSRLGDSRTSLGATSTADRLEQIPSKPSLTLHNSKSISQLSGTSLEILKEVEKALNPTIESGRTTVYTLRTGHVDEAPVQDIAKATWSPPKSQPGTQPSPLGSHPVRFNSATTTDSNSTAGSTTALPTFPLAEHKTEVIPGETLPYETTEQARLPTTSATPRFHLFKQAQPSVNPNKPRAGQTLPPTSAFTTTFITFAGGSKGLRKLSKRSKVSTTEEAPKLSLKHVRSGSTTNSNDLGDMSFCGSFLAALTCLERSNEKGSC